jgi:hypothetical protein
MTDDLPGLVARLREKRPDLADRLPTYPHGGWWQFTWEDDCCIPGTGLRALVGPEQARVMVIGLCAETLAEALVTYVTDPRGTVVFDGGGERMLHHADFTTALVSAVIALAEED